MTPIYIRLVSPTKALQSNNARQLLTLGLGQNNFRLPQLSNNILSTTSANQSRIIIAASPSTFNSSRDIMTQKINNPTIVQPIPKSFDVPLSSIDISATKSNNIKIIPTTGISPNTSPSIFKSTISSSKVNRDCSPCSQKTEQPVKRLKRKTKAEETEVKRRFWTENETITFINVWNDHYSKLTTGGFRHASIYQSMANELNKILEIDDLTGANVKSKIGNLTTEYRRERPYMDDSLLSDSIIVEEEQVMKSVNQASAPDLNLTQISEQADDLVQLKTNSDDSNNRNSVNLVTSLSSSTTIPIPKSDSPAQMALKPKKNASSKKKRASETKMDLMKELFGKIESANETAARSEIKILELLEKQTHVQEQSMANEREFLSLFKSIINNTTPNS
ncbi:unnamed protein product [Rotaria sp. Silwood1]|nr:unnamed protein product [Rotaria sp. Silwood1]